MTDNELLVLVKANLAIARSTWDDYLTNMINVSKQSIAREGITLEDTFEDNNLIVMYTSYLYRKRADDIPAMPRMLRYALNNRLFAEKCKIT